MVTHFLFVLSTRFTVTREDCTQEKTSGWDSTLSNDPHNSPTSFGSPFPTWLPIVLIYPWQKFDRCVLPRYLQETLGQPCRPHLVALCQLITHYARSPPWKTTHLQLHRKACCMHPSGCHVTMICICLDYRWTRSTRVSFLVACIVADVPMFIPLVASCILNQSSQSPVSRKWTIWIAYIPPQYNTVFGWIAIVDQAVYWERRRLFARFTFYSQSVPCVTWFGFEANAYITLIIPRKREL